MAAATDEELLRRYVRRWTHRPGRITVAELAKRSTLDRSALTRFLNGDRHTIGIGKARLIAGGLGMELGVLLSEAGVLPRAEVKLPEPEVPQGVIRAPDRAAVVQAIVESSDGYLRVLMTSLVSLHLERVKSMEIHQANPEDQMFLARICKKHASVVWNPRNAQAQPDVCRSCSLFQVTVVPDWDELTSLNERLKVAKNG